MQLCFAKKTLLLCHTWSCSQNTDHSGSILGYRLIQHMLQLLTVLYLGLVWSKWVPCWVCFAHNYLLVGCTNVTGYGKTKHSPHFVESEINTPSESTFIVDHNGTFIFFFQSDSPVQSYSLLNANNTQVDFDRTRYLFWTRRTSGWVRRRTIACAQESYAHKNRALHSGSPTHSVVMHVRSSARDRSSRIDYWTLNSRNVNSMFDANGRFFPSRSQIIVVNIHC